MQDPRRENAVLRFPVPYPEVRHGQTDGDMRLYGNEFFSTVTMLLSQTLGSSTGVLAVQIGIFLLGIFNIPDSLGIISQLWSIRPTNFLMYGAFSEYRLFNFDGHFLNAFQTAGLLYPLLIAVAVPITYLSYQRMQVKSR